jgi:phosphonate transport system ATP-binding protein
VAYIPQQLGLVRSLSVLDNVVTGALARVGGLAGLARLFPEDELRYARELLRRLGIERLTEQSAYAVSGGERQRVAIARALMQRPRILLADEFVSQLDHTTAREIMGAVAEIAAEGVAVVIATHELDVVRGDVQRLVLLRGGEKTLDVPAHRLDEVVAALP